MQHHSHKSCKHKVTVDTVKVTGESTFPCQPLPGRDTVFRNTEAEPDIAVGYNPINPDKPMVVVCYQQDRYNHDGGCNSDYMRISYDGGETFNRDPIPLPTVLCFNGPYERASDPHVKITSQGEILFCAIPFNVVRNFATGVSIAKYNVQIKDWVYVKDIDPQNGSQDSPNSSGSDYPTLVIDPQDPSGNTAYMGWTRYWYTDPGNSVTLDNMAFSKTTNGTDWSTPTIYAETPELDITLGWNPAFNTGIYPKSDTSIGINRFTLLENPCKSYSKIVALFNDSIGFDSGATNQYNLIYSCYSSDQGQTWSVPILIDLRFNSGSGSTATQIVDPDDYTKLVRGGDGNPYPAADRKRNRIFVVAGLDSLLNVANPTPSGIYMFVSLDGAQTWKTIGKINTRQDVEAFNPSIIVLENGHIAVSYYDFRNHSANPDTNLPLETDYWMDIFHYHEKDNTVSLVKEIRLTDVSFNFRNAIPLLGGNNTPAGYFLGDYMGIALNGHKIYTAYGIANPDPNNKTDIWSSTITL